MNVASWSGASVDALQNSLLNAAQPPFFLALKVLWVFGWSC
jgi:hypothetical protein